MHIYQNDLHAWKKANAPQKVEREAGCADTALVRMTGLEPAHLSVLEPNGSATILKELPYRLSVSLNICHQLLFLSIMHGLPII